MPSPSSPQQPRPELAPALELAAAGRHEEALEALRPVLERSPSPEAFRLAAEIEASRDRPREALAACQRALALAPEDAELHFLRGRLLDRLGALREAAVAFEEAARLAPGEVAPHAQASVVYARLGLRHKCLEHEDALVRLAPDNWSVHHNRGWALLALMRAEEALEAFRRSTALAPPERPEPLAAQAVALARLGRHAEAQRLLDSLPEGLRRNHAVGIAWSEVAPRTGKVREAIGLLREILEEEDRLPPLERQALHFALGQLHDHEGDVDRAFAHFHTANAMAPRSFRRELLASETEQILRTFSLAALAEAPKGPPDPRPVLIVGMPRSGTSLTEQILASHPLVHGAGELHSLTQVCLTLMERLGGRPLEEADPALVEGLARRYLEELTQGAGGAERVTDKMPTNFFWLGAAQVLLPGVRVIHCRRHPLDTLLSCYQQNLQGLHAYSNRLEDLAFFYHLYRWIMDHWAQALELPVLELRYEELVERPEEQVRRLLDFLELPWDERCLRFHESRRLVRTASFDQVRRPLYKGAVGRWRRYAPYLEPLRRELADFLDESAPYGYR